VVFDHRRFLAAASGPREYEVCPADKTSMKNQSRGAQTAIPRRPRAPPGIVSLGVAFCFEWRIGDLNDPRILRRKPHFLQRTTQNPTHGPSMTHTGHASRRSGPASPTSAEPASSRWRSNTPSGPRRRLGTSNMLPGRHHGERTPSGCCNGESPNGHGVCDDGRSTPPPPNGSPGACYVAWRAFCQSAKPNGRTDSLSLFSLSALGVRDREAGNGVGPVGDGVDKRGEPATGVSVT